MLGLIKKKEQKLMEKKVSIGYKFPFGEGNGNPLQYSWLGESQSGSLMGCRLWGRTESDTTEVT